MHQDWAFYKHHGGPDEYVGALVLVSYHTIHGSDQNTTDGVRRLVRVGYRDPGNEQFAGQAHGREGIIVSGRKG